MAKDKDVKYDTIVLDELPERPARNSQIEEKLAEVQAQPHLNGKFVCIAQYGQPTAATAAANILRKRHGKPGVAGWWFGTRKVKAEDGERTGLFVSYDPSKVVPGEAEKHAVEKADREQAARDKAAEKKNAGNGAPKQKTPAAAKA